MISLLTHVKSIFRCRHGMNTVFLNSRFWLITKLTWGHSWYAAAAQIEVAADFDKLLATVEGVNWNCWYIRLIHFYTPVWKMDVLCRGNVRPSVCPSVRPRFPDFSSTCFEISIWNLIYTFSGWHDMSSLSCITIGSLWPSLQPKLGQTHFLQSWPQKSR